MAEIIVEVTGKDVARSLERLWADDHDMRCSETRYRDDAIPFVRELMGAIDDPEFDRMVLGIATGRLAAAGELEGR